MFVATSCDSVIIPLLIYSFVVIPFFSCTKNLPWWQQLLNQNLNPNHKPRFIIWQNNKEESWHSDIERWWSLIRFWRMCPMPFEHYKIQKVLIMKEENKKILIRLKIEIAFRTWSFPLAQSLITNSTMIWITKIL